MTRTIPRVSLAVLIVLALALVGDRVMAANDPNPYEGITDDTGDFDFDETLVDPWIETETELPALPEPADMLRVKLDGLPSGFELKVDREGLMVDPRDRVVRLWVWLESGAGSARGTFEGFRCESSEYKIYAYANPQRDPVVRRVKRPAWRSIAKHGSTKYRSELVSNYFCSLGSGNPTERDIKTWLVQGRQRDKLFYSD